MTLNSKVLLVTGELAEGHAEKYAAETEVETEVKALPVPIASFMDLSLLLDELEEMDLSEYSMILVSGLARFDLQEAEDELGVPVFKGSKHVADLPRVLDNIEGMELSKTKPACEFLEEEMSVRVENRIRQIEEEAKRDFDESRNLTIGSGKGAVFAGADFPPRIIAEITDAPQRTNDELVEIASRYVRDGAEVIDIGMVAESEEAREIPRMISVLRENFDVPLSIDTTDESEIEAAVEHDIDLIVSIDGSIIEDFPGLEVPAVLIPRDPDRDYYPKGPSERLEYLETLLENANELGYDQVIADPILNPVGRGAYGSMTAFYELRRDRPEIPIFMGIGNVIELYDADSVGMTALLFGMASEINLSFVLVVEASDKTRGSVSEAAKARNMMTLAEGRDSVPKDLGLDLLKFKEKRRTFDPYDESIEEEAKVVEASPPGESPRDPRGFFKVFVRGPKIVAVFHAAEGSNLVIKGETAEGICQEIVERGLVSELSHAAYLGRELQKAETALRTDRGYIQEEDLF